MGQLVGSSGLSRLPHTSVARYGSGRQLCWTQVGSLLSLGVSWLKAGLAWPLLGQLGSPLYVLSSSSILTRAYSQGAGRTPKASKVWDPLRPRLGTGSLSLLTCSIGLAKSKGEPRVRRWENRQSHILMRTVAKSMQGWRTETLWQSTFHMLLLGIKVLLHPSDAPQAFWGSWSFFIKRKTISSLKK